MDKLKKYSCIIFIRRNCQFCREFVKIVKKKFTIKKIIYDDTRKINFMLFKKIDFIFCFRSKIILKEKILKKIKYFALNFHPGTPKYRGLGCTNYALYNDEKTYGSTAHLINKRIDNGKILMVNFFKIKKKDNLEKVLNNTYRSMLLLSRKVLKFIQKNPSISILNLKKNIKWSSKIKKRKELENFYRIKKNITKRELDKKIRATVIGKYRPYIELFGRKFILKIE